MIAPVDWGVIAPPRPAPSEPVQRAAEQQFQNETVDEYVRRLWQEQN